MTDYSSGGIIPGHSDHTYRSRGRCPLDGYLLIESDDSTEPEHVIPAAEIPTHDEALRRIAEAHGSEIVAAAEKITRQGDA